MKKYLVIAPGYPSEEDIYNNVFVHSRVKQYKEKKIDVIVFSIDKKNNENYKYDGVEVIRGNYDKLTKVLKNDNFSKILIHFGFKKTIKTVIKSAPNTKLLIWVHGVEALGWYRRLFTLKISEPHRFLGYVFFNIRQMVFMNSFIRNDRVDKTFIFVSEWMKNILEQDSFSNNKIKKYVIIPNVVDDGLFNYVEKVKEDRLKILSIRPYASKKYANDIAVKTVLELSKKPFFKDLTFSFYGDGKLFESTLKSIKNFDNVNIHKRFLSHQEISDIHKENGIMLIPTRQDAQGVSMCEAMSSGLVPLTSNNTAIPEYVCDDCGCLANNYYELASALEELYYNSDKFLNMSKNASKYITKICSPEVVINKELELIIK